MPDDNPKYKDRLFNFIFGSEQHKDWTLSLYNAINGSNYTDTDAIKITTIKEIMYLGMRNDVSFLISGEINLYEQQSSFNPNMPVRMLQYAGHLYGKYIVENKLNIYSSSLLKLPVPKLVVFYNGDKDTEDEIILKLSSSFPDGANPDIEVKVRMLNINYGRDLELLKAYEPLNEYSWLFAEVRKNKEHGGIESAIDKAITDMPEDFILKSFLVAHRTEVKGMLVSEYNETEIMELFKEEGRVEGRAEGRAEGRIEGGIRMLCDLVRKGIISLSKAAAEVQMTETEFLNKMRAFTEA